MIYTFLGGFLKMPQKVFVLMVAPYDLPTPICAMFVGRDKPYDLPKPVFEKTC